MLPQYDEINDNLGRLFSGLEQRRAPWIPIWTEAAELCFQNRAFFDDSPEEGKQVNRQLFNTAANRAVKIATAGFIGATSSRASRFFRLGLTDQDLERWPGVMDHLEQVERALYGEFRRSSFYDAIGEHVPNGFVINTSTVFVDEDITRQTLLFQPCHPKEMYIDEDADGQVDTAVRCFYRSNKALLQRFGDNIPKDRAGVMKEDLIGRTKIKHYVFPMDIRIAEAYEAMLTAPFPFISIWMLDDKVLEVGGYWEFPYPTWRYSKNTDEVYGRGPGVNVISEALGANQISRGRLRLSNLTTDPTMLVDKGLAGQDKVIPGNHIYRAKPNEQIQAVEVGKNYPITIDTENRIEQVIGEFFDVDMWRTLMTSERTRTAFEVDQILSEKASLLGPMTDRYNTESLSKMIKRAYAIGVRAGRIPPPPEIIAKSGGKFVIDFIGYLSQLQKKHFLVAGLQAGVGFMQATMQLFPESKDVVNGDELMRTGLDGHGMAQTIIREEPDVQQIRATRIQMQQAEAQAQLEAGAIMNMTKKVDPNAQPQEGSIVDRISR